MDELQESLSRLLENPEELKRMTDMASELLGGGEEPAPESPKLPDLSALMGKLHGGNSDTQKLLQAMKPFLAPERQARLSRAGAPGETQPRHARGKARLRGLRRVHAARRGGWR